jgi:hypothetical protein
MYTVKYYDRYGDIWTTEYNSGLYSFNQLVDKFENRLYGQLISITFSEKKAA